MLIRGTGPNGLYQAGSDKAVLTELRRCSGDVITGVRFTGVPFGEK